MVDNNENLINTNNSLISKIKLTSPDFYGILGNKYILYNRIGKGLSSKVFSGRKIDSSSKKIFLAIKICKKTYDNKMFIEEGYINKKLPNSSYIIKYYDSGKDNLIKSKSKKSIQVLYHIFEYSDYGMLSNYINIDNNLKGFGEIIGRIIFKQILNGIEIIHKNGISHQDIKLENILVSSNYQMKLIDFGFAMEIFPNNKKEIRFSRYGTNGYFPPEVYINRDVDAIKSDIFSLGVTLFIIVTGFKPFNSTKRCDNLYRKIWRRNYDSYWNDLPIKSLELSKNFKELMNKYFALNINERIKNIEEIRLDKWMIEGKIDVEKERELLRIEMDKRRQKMEETKENGK